MELLASDCWFFVGELGSRDRLGPISIGTSIWERRKESVRRKGD